MIYHGKRIRSATSIDNYMSEKGFIEMLILMKTINWDQLSHITYSIEGTRAGHA